MNEGDKSEQMRKRIKTEVDWLNATDREMAMSLQREATAASVLAALISETAFQLPLTGHDVARVRIAVALADALRAELEKKS